MKTEYDANAAFLYPYTGEQERRFFYALMLRDRGEISFDLCGFPGGKIGRQGIYTFTPENAVLLRNISISAPMRKPGRGGYVIAAASRFSYFVLLDFKSSNIPKILGSISFASCV